MGQKIYLLSFLFYKHCTKMPFSMLKRHKGKKIWFSFSMSKITIYSSVFFRTSCQPSQVSHYIFEQIFFLFAISLGQDNLRNSLNIPTKGFVPSLSYAHIFVWKILYSPLQEDNFLMPEQLCYINFRSQTKKYF